MALTLDQLRRLCDQAQFRYFVDPARPTLLANVDGLAGRYQFVMQLELDGQFLQFRTMSYAHCGPSHQHHGALLRLLGDLNYHLRFVKFGWDPSDGEVVAYADTWLMDAGLTQRQFDRILGTYLPSLDRNYARIAQVVQTGDDPGPIDVTELLKSADQSREGIADRLRKLLGGKDKRAPQDVKEPDIESL
jgi:hypothetical protein